MTGIEPILEEAARIVFAQIRRRLEGQDPARETRTDGRADTVRNVNHGRVSGTLIQAHTVRQTR